MQLRVCVLLAAVGAARGAALGDELVAAIRRDLQLDNDDYADLRHARALTNPPRDSPPSTNTPTPPSTNTPTPPSTNTSTPPSTGTPTPPSTLIPTSASSSAAPIAPVKPHVKPIKLHLPSLLRRAMQHSPAVSSISDPKPSKASTLEVVKVRSWYTSTTPRKKTKATVASTTAPTLLPRSKDLEPQKAFHANDVAAPGKQATAGKGIQKKAKQSEEYFKKEMDSLVKSLKQREREEAREPARARATPVMRMRGRGAGRGGGRARAGLGRKGRGWRGRLLDAPDAQLPPAEVLDMAPARGARIHSKRLRHRLCSRSILNPEGPKYDSRGKIYLNRFTPRGQGRFDFHATRAPRLLLPRCCNCCRKSVLGCE